MLPTGLSHIFHKLPSLSPISHSYHIHHLSVTVISNCTEFLSLVDGYWGGFLSEQSSSSHPSLSFRFYCVPPDWDLSYSIPHNWHLYEKSTHITSYRSGDSFLFCFRDNGVFIVDCVRKEGLGYMKQPVTMSMLEQIFRIVFMPSFFYLLQAYGIFALHASAVAWNNQGILLAGSSGQGKTTLLLQLLRAGFDYMADDTVFLQDTGNIPAMLSFPAPAKISAHTLEFFPELQWIKTRKSPNKRGKYLVNLVTAFQRAPVHIAKPVLLLLPEISPHHPSTIKPVSRMEAAIQWIPENNFISSSVSTRKNFEILSCFIRKVACYRVMLGRQMNEIGPKLMSLLPQ